MFGTDNSLSKYQPSDEEEELITGLKYKAPKEKWELIEHAIKLNKNVKYEDPEGLAVIFFLNSQSERT